MIFDFNYCDSGFFNFSETVGSALLDYSKDYSLSSIKHDKLSITCNFINLMNKLVLSITLTILLIGYVILDLSLNDDLWSVSKSFALSM